MSRSDGRPSALNVAISCVVVFALCLFVAFAFVGCPLS